MALNSPDYRPYIDLRFLDLHAQDVFAQGLADASSKMPLWQPREGNREVLLLATQAIIAERMTFDLNRLPTAMLVGLANAIGVPYFYGTAPTASVTFTCADTLGHTIPAGTIVRLRTLGANPVEVLFTTDSAVTIPAASSVSAAVPVTATTLTSLANATPAGTAVEVVTNLAYIERATLVTAVAGGADAEESSKYLLRVTTRLSRLSSSYSRPFDMEQHVLDSFPQIQRSRVVQRWDGIDPDTAGIDRGHVTMVLAGTGGSLVTPADKSTLQNAIQESMGTNIELHLIDATVVTVPVTVSVTKRFLFTDAAVRADVASVLAAWLNFDVWPWGYTIQPTEVIARVDTAESVDFVNSVTLPAAPVVLGITDLPVLGAVTTTVVAP